MGKISPIFSLSSIPRSIESRQMHQKFSKSRSFRTKFGNWRGEIGQTRRVASISYPIGAILAHGHTFCKVKISGGSGCRIVRVGEDATAI